MSKDILGLARSVKPASRMKFDLGGVLPVPAEHPLTQTAAIENRPSVIVSPYPGKRGRLTSEAPMLDPSIRSDSDLKTWSPATPDLIGAPVPPPIQHPVRIEPRHEQLTKHTQKIFADKGFQDFAEGLTGLRGIKAVPIKGMWEGNQEPSFVLQHPDMTPEAADKLSHALGFGFQQDATVRVDHNPYADQGIPTMLLGNGKKLNDKQIDAIMKAASEEGLGASSTVDGKAVKFLHFGGDEELPDFHDKIERISQRTNMPEKLLVHSTSELIDNENYLPRLFGTDRSREGDPNSPSEPSDLFRGLVTHVLAPYAKAVAGEGFRLSPERLQETYGLTPEETTHVREALYPSGRKVNDRTTVPLMEDKEQLDVRPTGFGNKATVDDVLQGLQDRAARKGQISPNDYSDAAKKSIADDIAKEVAYHVGHSDKSAIGWYDEALKKAMAHYHDVFPELKTDPDKEMLFHALLGITSQGNNVYENSVYAARMYDMIRKGATIPEALKQLKGGFGNQTRAIEQNIEKFHHLINNNGYDRMRDIFNQKKSVSEWNKILREDKTLHGPNKEPLSMQGGKDQKITGWMVFGPKIGSFINNLHGDYSTLTADLWFSRTWNRLLGQNFIHTPLAENKQYQDFRDAARAEFMAHNGFPFEQQPMKTSEGKITNKPWEHGTDLKGMSYGDFEDLMGDPEKLRELAYDLEEKYRKGGFKDKSDLRRRAKNWVQNRETPVAAPRGDVERDFQQRTVEEAQNLLKKKYGLNISVADIQAALWFHEKELFSKLGVASEKAQPADYADAARHTMDLLNKGDLYTVKSKQKKPAAMPPAMPEAPPKESFKRGGSVHPAHGIAGVHIVTAEAGEPVFSGRP